MKQVELEAIIAQSVQRAITQDIKPFIALTAEKAAHQAVDSSVHKLLAGLGLDAHDPTEAQADMVFLRNLRHGSSYVQRHCTGAILSALIGSGLWLLWSAFKDVLAR